MKVHTDLKELLEDFVSNYYEKGDPMETTLAGVIDKFVSSNSLASVEPEPLAKNKDSESKIFRCHDQQWLYCSCKDECAKGNPQI